jgi:Ca2+-binding RTX toxin-like protein
MTQLANLFPTHAGVTNLYLNFDGSTEHLVSAFETTTGNRNRDIQEILFRTAEMFAPFNVQVQRIHGNGAHADSGGHSTVFIGDKLGNSSFLEGPDGEQTVENTTRAYAPERDRPTMTTWLHAPNSNPYDIAFVDPVSWDWSSQGGIQDYATWGNMQIARAVAHEAGHTFGLAHVLSGGVSEAMSYDAENSVFRNVGYGITLQNNTPDGVVIDETAVMMWMWDPPGPVPPQLSTIISQNSFTYLQQVLGARSADFANVARTSAVTPGFDSGTLNSLSPNGGTKLGSVNRPGDYDVYATSVVTKRWLRVKVEQNGSDVDPVVFVTTGNGETVLAFNDDGGAVWPNSEVVFEAEAGKVYKIVVGSYGGTSTGGYRVTVNKAFNVNPDIGPIGDVASKQVPIDPLGAAEDQVAELQAGGGQLTTPLRGDVFLPAVGGDISLAGGVLTIKGTDLNDAVEVRYVEEVGGGVSAAPTDFIRVTLSNPTGDRVEFFHTASVDSIEFFGYAGNDVFTNATFVGATISGGSGNDFLNSGFGNDVIEGGPGSDAVFAGDGHDFVVGGPGNDNLNGGNGNDHLIGEAPGPVGHDILIGGAGDDLLEGRAGNDQLLGQAGRDILIGGPGMDLLVGGPGDDLLIGGWIKFPVLGTAVEAIAKEWTSPHPFLIRVWNLRGTPHATFPLRLNGGFFLKPGVTVIDDGVKDQLFGQGDRDWFLIGGFDTLDFVVGEAVN